MHDARVAGMEFYGLDISIFGEVQLNDEALKHIGSVSCNVELLRNLPTGSKLGRRGFPSRVSFCVRSGSTINARVGSGVRIRSVAPAPIVFIAGGLAVKTRDRTLSRSTFGCV